MSRNARRTGSLFSSLNPFSRRVDRALEWKRSRRLRVEALEDRRVLAVTWNIIPIAAGTVVGNGVDDMPGNADDEVTIAIPTEVLEAFNEATRIFDQYLTDNITVNLELGWAINFEPNVHAFASSPSIAEFYTDVVTALQTDQSTPADSEALANLQGVPDFDMLLNLTNNHPDGAGSLTPYLDDDGDDNNTTLSIKRANAKALGLLSANDAGVDGRIVFNSTRNWDFVRADGVAGLDFTGISAHEIGHFLGFTSGVDSLDFDNQPNGEAGRNDDGFRATVLDLFRFSTESVAMGGPGTIDFTADGRTKFFSIDGGATSLAEFSEGENNGTPSRQASHWIEATPEIGMMDPTTNSDDIDFFTPLDLLALDVIGWDINAEALSSTPTIEGTNADDVFIVSLNPSDTSRVQVQLNGAIVATFAVADIDQLTIAGLGGNDTLIVDSSEGLIGLTRAIVFEGGTGDDTVELRQAGGDLRTSETITVGATPGSGTSTIIGGGVIQEVRFDDIEPIITNVPAALMVINGALIGSLLHGANQITYDSSDLFGLSWGRVTIDAFEPVHFINKTAVTLNGENGDDTIVVNNADLPTGLTTLTVNGGAGHDEIRLESLPDAGATTYDVTVVSGGTGNDTIDGSAIVAGTPLTIDGNSGNDTITGGAGIDTIQAGIGDDIIYDTPGNDTISGGTGEDQYLIRGNSLNNTILVTQNAPSAVVADLYTLAVVNLGLSSTKNIGKNFALAPADAGNRPDIERIRIEGLAGSDQIAITQADEYSDLDLNNGLILHTIPFTVDGGTTGNDRLLVNDAGLGDLVIQRVSADARDGSFVVGGMAAIEYAGIEFPLVGPQNPITGGTGTDGAGRLVVFKFDPFEINDTLPAATFLGAGPTVNADPTIDPSGFDGFPGDNDFYQFVAQETGTLDLQLYFEPIGTLANGRPGLFNDGELVVTAFDSDGLPIAIGTASDLVDPAGNKIGERITLPVVRNNTYYLRVQGETLDGVSAVNVYNFTGITVAAPIPELVDLQAASDSGRHNGDNITKITTPTFDIILDDDRIDEFMNIDLVPDTVNDDAQTLNNGAGMRIDYGVEVFNNGVSIGFAFYTGVGNTWRFTATAGDLSEGDFNHIAAAVWVRDRADPAVVGRHLLSNSLQVTLDTLTPPGSFGLPDAQSTTDGLVHSTDSGVITTPSLYADRVTSDTTPTFWGIAEANTVVRVFLDINNNGIIDLGTDILLGQDVAIPEDGNVAFPDGYWEITSALDLNQLAALPKDGVRRLLMTAEDVAGNPMPMNGQIADGIDELNIFLDTQGPQVFDPAGPTQPVFIPGFEEFDLFDPKPSVNGYTPLINQLTINIRDLPFRSNIDPNFLYVALQEDVAEALGNYMLVGDHVGTIGITAVDVVNIAPVNGEQATATVTLTFAAPLPDDRYTLTLKDGIVDPAGNALDGESNASGPLDDPFFPSGDGVSGGNFVARFTVDSRPEIGTYIPTTISIDINGNFVWDPANAQIGNDFTNVDLTFNMQLEDEVTGSPIAGGYGVHDLVFAGKFFTDQLLVGDDAVFVIDISGSTSGAFGGDPVGDLNGDGSSDTILDAEIAAFLALNQQLIDRGLGNTSKVAIVAFDSNSNLLDMDPVAPGVQVSTFPLADTNANGMRDVDEALRSLNDAGGTDFEVALQGALSAIAMAGIAPGNGNVIFLSDGFGGGAFLDEVDAIRNGQNMNLRAFGVGPGASLLQLQQIDPAAVTFSDTNELLAAFGGGGGAGGVGPERAFDQLAVFGALNQNTYRWLIDTNSDGVVNPGEGDIFTFQPRFVGSFDTASAIPIAGDFDNNPDNGDEIGLYNAGRWALDTNRDFVIDAGDTFINSNLFGHPIVGDFNGDGLDDLAVHHAVDHQFRFDLNRNGTIDDRIDWGFPGVLEIPVAADMNQDGIDDIGLWVPRNSTQIDRTEAEWFFLISDGSSPAGGFNVNNLDHAFEIVPFGTDITAHFGDERARPIVGNFDPPVTASGSQSPTPNVVLEMPGDFNMDGLVDTADRELWKSQFGQTGADLAADGNGDGKVDARDFTIWRNNLGMTSEEFAAAHAIVTPGDYNSDGIVDTADQEVWKVQFGMTGALAADGNGDGKVDARDFTIWRNNLSVASAPSSFAAGLAAAMEASPSPLDASAADSAHESSAARSLSTANVGFRPTGRSGLVTPTSELLPATVDSLFAQDAEDLLLYGPQVLDELDQTDLEDLFDLSVEERVAEERVAEEMELQVTL